MAQHTWTHRHYASIDQKTPKVTCATHTLCPPQTHRHGLADTQTDMYIETDTRDYTYSNTDKGRSKSIHAFLTFDDTDTSRKERSIQTSMLVDTQNGKSTDRHIKTEPHPHALP